MKLALGLGFRVGTHLDMYNRMKHVFEIYLSIIFITACAGMYHNCIMAPASSPSAYDLSYNEQ